MPTEELIFGMCFFAHILRSVSQCHEGKVENTNYAPSSKQVFRSDMISKSDQHQAIRQTIAQKTLVSVA
jgi:hypothetical protein